MKHFEQPELEVQKILVEDIMEVSLGGGYGDTETGDDEFVQG